MNTKRSFKRFAGHASILIMLNSALMFAGCGGSGGGGSIFTSPVAYNLGYDDGFLDDTQYFYGYDDSFLNDTDDEIWYVGDLIPYINDNSYDAGYYDGQFDAYSDGYFVAYRYAFIIGFSEGYDNAYWDHYFDFLATDWHVELLHTGFNDVYNDGFSEGRIFGAYDYEAFLPFDWLDAFLDWESGTDLYFIEVDKGTGDLGPVILYEWGQNPFDLFASPARASIAADETMKMRAGTTLATRNGITINPLDVARLLTVEQEASLNIIPTDTTRTNRTLTLTSTWLERIDAYNQFAFGTRSTNRIRSGDRVVVSPETE